MLGYLSAALRVPSREHVFGASKGLSAALQGNPTAVSGERRRRGVARGKHSRRHRAQPNAADDGSLDPFVGFRITLRFAATLCRRCGEKRVAADPCPSCGLPPERGEADSRAQRRRRAADTIKQQLLAGPPSAQDRQDLSETLASLSGLPRRLAQALEGLDDGGAAEQRALAATTTVLDALHAARAQVNSDWPRPLRRYARGAAVAVAELTDAVMELVDAYSARNIRTAQEHVEHAERLLGKAAAAADRFYDELGFAEAVLAMHEGDLISACVSRELDRLAAPAGIAGLLALDTAGRQRLPMLAQDGEPGLGLQVEIVVLTSAVALDSDLLLAKAAQAQFIIESAGGLRALSSSTAWAERQRAATTVLMDACQDLRDVSELPNRPHRREIRDVLKFVQDLVEGPLRHSLATLLACRDGGPTSERYKSAWAGTGTSVIEQARKRLPALLTDELSPAARHASAHVDYYVHDDGSVTLQKSKPTPTTMSAEALTDAALATLETALGLQLGVLAACEAAGMLPDNGDLLDELDPELTTKLMLSALGWRGISVDQAPGLLRITGEPSGQAPFATIGMLLARLEGDVQALELVALRPGSASTLRAETAPFVAWSQREDSDDEFASMLLFVRALAGVHIDGAALITQEGLRHAAAIFIGEEINSEPAAASSRLAQVRAWARDFGDPGLDRALQGVQRALMSLALGVAPRPEEQHAIDQVADWERTGTPLPTGW